MDTLPKATPKKQTKGIHIMNKLDNIYIYTLATVLALFAVSFFASIITENINTFNASIVLMILAIFITPIFELIETATKGKE